MRFLEITLILSLILFAFLARKNRKLLLLPLLAALIQLLVEGYRWQMLPAYTLAISEACLAFYIPRGRNLLSVSGSLLGAILFIAAVALPTLLPIPSPEGPTGPYPVGTRTYYFVDDSRTDPYAPEAGTPRELLLQVWYPAQDIERYEIAPWMENPEIVAVGVSRLFELPDFMFDHLVYAKTDSYMSPPVLENGEAFPLILFSHGLQGFRAQGTFQTQELASRGYIVAAVEHTYASMITVFPDDRIAEHNEDVVLEGDSYETSFEALVVQWTQDLSYVTDQLENMNTAPGGMFEGKIDLERIGALGHSTGGGAALMFCAVDDRCDTVFGMDPALVTLDDALIASGYPKPFFVVFSEVWADGLDQTNLRLLLANAKSAHESVYIEGTAHFDFSDLPAATPLATALGLRGPINGDLVLDIIKQLTVSHFDQAFKGNSADWLASLIGTFPEVRLHHP